MNFFDELLKEINPTIVLFDRFMTEEQFGWRVHESAPNAMKVLDTEDLHCLRKTRQDCIKKNKEFSPNLLLNSETAKREIASIYRCDLTLIISSLEMDILRNIFNISDSLLCYLPFLVDTITERDQKSWKGFDNRSDFVSIGNFLHAPNLDATIQLKQKIWPKIRKEIPAAQLHVYGAYPTQQVLQLNNKKEGFLVHGFVENADEVISSSKVLLAPLRFGAGLKGKLIQAMVNGTPSITTSIGSEGMHDSMPWSGFVEDDIESLIKGAVELYQDHNLWKEKQKNGAAIINSLYSKQDHLLRFSEKIQIIITNLTEHRSQNFIGQMLQHHTMNSYKYLSKWIEEKNKD